MERNNCWEVMNCFRQPEGNDIIKLGGCPAAKHSEFDGTNRGKLAGRLCWAVAGKS